MSGKPGQRAGRAVRKREMIHFLLGAALLVTEGFADDAIGRRLREAATASWKSLEDLALVSRFDLTVTFLAPRTSHASVRFNGEPSRFRCERRTGDSLFVAGANAAYGFTCEASRDEAFQVTSLVPMHGPVAREMLERTEIQKAFRIEVFPLAEVVSHPSFKATPVKRADADDTEFEVSFRCQIESPKGPILKGGRLRFSNDERWLPLGFEATIEYPDGAAVVLGEAVFDGYSLARGLPRSFGYKVTEPDTGKIVRHLVGHYANIREGNLSKDEARLSAWGLPEPAEFSTTVPGRQFWLMLSNVIAILVILVGVALRRWAASANPVSKWPQ